MLMEGRGGYAISLNWWAWYMIVHCPTPWAYCAFLGIMFHTYHVLWCVFVSTSFARYK